MSEYFFGLGPKHLPKRIAKIAERHDAWLVNYTEPNGHKRHWFACRNMGEPFDSDRANKVMDDITKEIR